jgi:hypothetical protein
LGDFAPHRPPHQQIQTRHHLAEAPFGQGKKFCGCPRFLLLEAAGWAVEAGVGLAE